MEEADRGLPTEENPEIWAQLVPGALTQNRQAFLAAWMAGRALRNRLIFRLVAGLAALAALLGITAWALHALLNGTPVALWQCLLPPLFALLLLLALKDMPLHRQLRRIRSATLFPDHLHLVLDTGEQDLSLALLFNGETVPTLELCPVSMEDTQSMQLYSADGTDTEVSTPESADLTAR